MRDSSVLDWCKSLCNRALRLTADGLVVVRGLVTTSNTNGYRLSTCGTRTVDLLFDSDFYYLSLGIASDQAWSPLHSTSRYMGATST